MARQISGDVGKSLKRSLLLDPQRVKRATTEPPRLNRFVEPSIWDVDEELGFEMALSLSPKSRKAKGGTHEHATPLMLRRAPSRRADQLMMFAPLGQPTPATEACTFPHFNSCQHCRKILNVEDARRQSGLCKECYFLSHKSCGICKASLPLRQVHKDVELCHKCWSACDKTCRICKASLELGQLHWGTGLCDDCYNSCQKTCRMCQTHLEKQQLHWGSGLCDPCYNRCQKKCRICADKLTFDKLHWGTGLCDPCFDNSEKTCRMCSDRIQLGSVHWRTGLCDACYDKSDKTCKMCESRLELERLHEGTGLCEVCYDSCGTTCEMCTTAINSTQLHWGTGLCDACYDACHKSCRICQMPLPFGEMKWGTGLCNACYSNCDKSCTICNDKIELGQLHWGTGLCDRCFDNCEKECRSCKIPLALGQFRWGTGLCNACYDAKQARGTRTEPQRFRPGVKAAIAAQFIFYLAPAVIQPSLFLEIQGRWPSNPAGIYAGVLATASFFSMVAPVPLGMWAASRGEGEVYAGVASIAAAGGIGAAVAGAFPVLAMSWGCISLPPAVRGVRAAYFAKEVPPEELSRAGQLASSAGLLGGFLGPLIATALTQLLKLLEYGNEEARHDGFVIASCIAFALHSMASVVLGKSMAKPKKLATARSTSDSTKPLLECCEQCDAQLSSEEQCYATALCDRCYDSYDGHGFGFGRYCRNLLIAFCLIACLLEFSMNAGVIAAFQPIVVQVLNWDASFVAAVNFAGAGLSVVISLTLAQLRLPERGQSAVAAGLYLISVLLFTWPPVVQWRLVVGLMCGIKAQILFMSPFTAVFSRLIGRARVTNRLMTALCLAPAIGGALGTSAAPLFLAYRGTWVAALASVPAVIAVSIIVLGWRFTER